MKSCFFIIFLGFLHELSIYNDIYGSKREVQKANPLILVRFTHFAPLTGIAGIDGFPTTFEHPEAFLNASGRPLACKASLLKVLRGLDNPVSP